MIIERIRKETKEAHASLEKVIIPRIKNATHEGYLQLLCLFYGYYQPVENLIDQYISSSIVPEFDHRRKAQTILSDIHALNKETAYPEVCGDIPHISNEYQALGAMYVLEGSTLGGKIISQMLRKGLDMNDDSAVQFFSGYGDRTDAMWGSFVRVLDNYTADEAQQNEIVAGAVSTFSLFKKWIVAHQ